MHRAIVICLNEFFNYEIVTKQNVSEEKKMKNKIYSSTTADENWPRLFTNFSFRKKKNQLQISQQMRHMIQEINNFIKLFLIICV